MEKIHTKTQKEVYKLRMQGKSYSEIADILGKSPESVANCARRIGVYLSESEKRESRRESRQTFLTRNNSQRVARNKYLVESRFPNLEYISGWLSIDREIITLKCRMCGNEFKRSSVYIRHKKAKPSCPYCLEREKELKVHADQQAREQTKRELQAKKEEEFWKRPMMQRSFSFCHECGSIMYENRKYCSEKCRKAVNNRRKKDKRLRKIKDIKKENITLKELYKRDSGVCWICGGVCDYDDFTKDEKGSFIAGHNYPSIDHVHPLSKGGQHTWNNVKLAHFYCNTLKSAKVVGV